MGFWRYVQDYHEPAMFAVIYNVFFSFVCVSKGILSLSVFY